MPIPQPRTDAEMRARLAELQERCQGVWSLWLYPADACFASFAAATAANRITAEIVRQMQAFNAVAERVADPQQRTLCLGCGTRFHPELYPAAIAILEPETAVRGEAVVLPLCGPCWDEEEAVLAKIRSMLAAGLNAEIRTIDIHAGAGHA